MGNTLVGEQELQGLVFGGSWRLCSRVIDAIEPASGRKIGQIGIGDAVDIADASASARKAQRNWAVLPADQRAAILNRAADVGENNREEIVQWIVRESGSIKAKADFELSLTLKAIRLAAAMPHQAQGLILPSESGTTSLARRRPLGVVGVIAPFNFPLYLAVRAVAPALAVGNAVVLKPDPRTALCGGVVIARLFECAGLPEGVLHVIPGLADAGEALCTDPNIAMIQFTGSTSAGRTVGRIAGEHLKKVSLELGGKNSLIILDDADMELALRNAAWAAYLHQGQICMSAGRILVHSTIADEFAEKLAAKASALPVGDPVSEMVALGPLISQKQVEHVKAIVDRSIAEGAHLVAGGSADGLFFRPTVLSAVRSSMSLFKEEVFGPVAVIVPFESDDEAIALANLTEYGLSAGIISPDVGRAIAMADRLNTGLIHINDQTVNDDVVNPFGGVGASGNGSSIGGPSNWEEFTSWQWMTLKCSPPAYPL